jgi:hypothetical protein
MSILPSNKGKKFHFKNIGYGHVEDEVIAQFDGWYAVIQLLEFENNDHQGDRFQLRFGYLNIDGKLIARPLYLDKKQLAALGRNALSPEHQIIRDMLEPFLQALK